MNLSRLLMAAGAMLAVSCAAAPLELQLVTRSVLEERLRAGEVSGREREDRIADLFQQVGCTVERQSIERHVDNVICNLPGETNATILIGGHFDFIDRGKGIVDDWSGTSLMISLYQTLKTERPNHHTYRFVAFGGEERGLIGSTRYVKEMSAEEKAGTQAFVNLECLGLTAPKVWVSRSTPALVAKLAGIAHALNITLGGVNVERVGDDDTHPFLRNKIPVISIHSITQEKFSILHSSRDNMGAIHSDEYYDAYRLVAFYLKYLDGDLSQ